MKTSRRADRMERSHRRRRMTGALSLVSLMDIFTILVFFLLVNSSEMEIIPSSKAVTLPESIAEQKPRETVLVMVTGSEILVQGEPVALVQDVLQDSGEVIEPLRAAVVAQARKSVLTGPDGEPLPREITIMGDKEVPYRILKKVMVSCTHADYERISLAVIQKAPTGATGEAG